MTKAELQSALNAATQTEDFENNNDLNMYCVNIFDTHRPKSLLARKATLSLIYLGAGGWPVCPVFLAILGYRLLAVSNRPAGNLQAASFHRCTLTADSSFRIELANR
jgi:hypothetical protein